MDMDFTSTFSHKVTAPSQNVLRPSYAPNPRLPTPFQQVNQSSPSRERSPNMPSVNVTYAGMRTAARQRREG